MFLFKYLFIVKTSKILLCFIVVYIRFTVSQCTKFYCSCLTVTQYLLINISLFLSQLFLASSNHCFSFNFYKINLKRLFLML
jgi:hypothetical protein